MKKLLLSAALGLSALMSAPASAAVLFTFTPGFTPGGASPTAGFTVINTFDNDTGITGNNFQIKVSPSDGDGALPANSVPFGTTYLSVLGGGSATIGLGLVKAFQFDWGSIDEYNTLEITSTGGTTFIYPGTGPGDNFNNLANGNQGIGATNGVFTVYGDAGELFSTIKLTSGRNSFEIDNLAVKGAVPEPSTWMMMIFGFGIVGYSLRSRRRFSIQSFS